MEVCRRSSGLLLLLGLSLLASTLQGVQGEVESEGPSESECRPYIEKALKELETGEPRESTETGDSREDLPTVEITTDDPDRQDDNEDNDTDEDGNSKESAEEPAIDQTSEQENAQDSKEAADDDGDSENKEDDGSDEQQDQAVEDDKQSEETTDEQPSKEDSKEDTKEEEDDEKESLEQADEPDSKEGTDEQTEAESKEDEQKEDAEKSGESKEDQADTNEEESKEDDAEATATEEGPESKEDEPDTKEDDDSKEDSENKDDSVEEQGVETESKEDQEPSKEDQDSKEDKDDSKADDDDSKADDDDSKADDNDSKVDDDGKSGEDDSKADDGDSKADDGDSKDDDGDSKDDDGDSKAEEDSKEGGKSGEDEQSVETGGDEAKSKEDDGDADSKEQAGESKEDSKEQAGESKEDSKEQAGKSKEDDKDEDGDAEEESKEADDKQSDEKDGGDAESTEGSDSAPEEELSLDIEIPTELRPREHVEKLLKLDDDSSETEKILNRVSEITLKELKKLYENAIKPLEVLYKYRDLSNRHFGDAEIFSKPLILFMGPWSGGKSSIINYLVNNEYNETSLKTGAEPSPAYFNILMYGEEPEIIDGTELAADFTFSGLQKFGQGLEERLRGVKLPNKLLEKVNIVEIPGILEVRKQVSRVFPFNDACQWFIDRADIIFLVYDPSKLDVGPETEAILDQLKGREHQTRIILNKADQVKPEELMRVQGALIWNISPLMSSPQPPTMYTTSLWSRPYESWAPVRLLQAQERAFLRDLRSAIDKRIENKIASARRFAVRVRNHAKMVDCYLTTYYNHKSVFGNRKQVADEIIEHPQDYHIYEGLSTLTNISRYDLPDPEVYKDFFKLNPLYDFQQLSATCTYFRGCPINRLDVAIAYDLPELVGTHKKLVENALAEAESQSTAAPGS